MACQKISRNSSLETPEMVMALRSLAAQLGALSFALVSPLQFIWDSRPSTQAIARLQEKAPAMSTQLGLQLGRASRYAAASPLNSTSVLTAKAWMVLTLRRDDHTRSREYQRC
jgi:hypothetical protein